MVTYFLTSKIEYLIGVALKEEALDAKLNSIGGDDFGNILTKPGLAEPLPHGRKNTGKTESYLRGLLYGGEPVKTNFFTVGGTALSDALPYISGGDIPENSRYVRIFIDSDDADGTVVARYYPNASDPAIADIPSGDELKFGIPVFKNQELKISYPKNLFTTRFVVKAGCRVTAVYYG